MKKKTHDEFIAEMQIKHPDLKILSQYKSNREKVIVEDLLGIQYETLAGGLSSGQIPSINSAINKNAAFKTLSEQKHGINKFDYSDSIYITNNKKIKIKCLSCYNTFYQQPSNHMFGQGCPKCSETQRRITRKIERNKTILKDIVMIHGHNIKLDKFEYKGMCYKTLFGCNINKEHGYWLATPEKPLSDCNLGSG
jgi:Zn finger protein HypA/HybF involved in hydrogenase expression